MTEINWDQVLHLSKNEFSENPKFAEPKLIYSLSQAREILSEKFFPSRATGALARFSGSSSSQHYSVSQLSRACDVFIEGKPIQNYLCLLSTGLFNGIGIYLDTSGNDGRPWIMFHLDIRRIGFKPNIPFVWFSTRTHNKNHYFYPQVKPEYWKLLQDGRLYVDRKYGDYKASAVIGSD